MNERDVVVTEQLLDLMDTLKDLERRGLIEWEVTDDDVRVRPTEAGLAAVRDEAVQRVG